MNGKAEATEFYGLIVQKLEVQMEVLPGVQAPSGICEEGIFPASPEQASLGLCPQFLVSS